MQSSYPSRDAPVGTNLVRTNMPKTTREQTHQFVLPGGRIQSFTWSVSIKGIDDPDKGNMGNNVPGTETIIVGKNPYHDNYMYALPHKTHYGFSVKSTWESDVDVFVDGTNPENLIGTWRITPKSNAWIWRSANVDRALVLLKADSKEGTGAGIKNDEYSGTIIFKMKPIVEEDTEAYQEMMRQQHAEADNCDDDGVAKCRKKKRRSVNNMNTESTSVRGFSAAGTAFGKKVNQTFSSAVIKRHINNYDHLQMNYVLVVDNTPKKEEFSCAYGHHMKPVPLTKRSDFGV